MVYFTIVRVSGNREDRLSAFFRLSGVTFILSYRISIQLYRVWILFYPAACILSYRSLSYPIVYLVKNNIEGIVFSLFRNFLPLKKGGNLHLNKF